MNIFLIRHAERDKDSAKVDWEQPLSPRGRVQAEALAIRLKTEDTPTLFLASEWVHSQETADIIKAKLFPSAQTILLETLTPFKKGKEFKLNDMIDEVKQKGFDLRAHNSVCIILHHPRQTQLAMMLSGHDYENWRSELEPRNAEAICLSADSLDEFVKGKAIEKTRIIGD